jgi:hypothetical protein
MHLLSLYLLVLISIRNLLDKYAQALTSTEVVKIQNECILSHLLYPFYFHQTFTLRDIEMCENEQLNKSKHAFDPFEMSGSDTDEGEEEVKQDSNNIDSDVVQNISNLIIYN